MCILSDGIHMYFNGHICWALSKYWEPWEPCKQWEPWQHCKPLRTLGNVVSILESWEHCEQWGTVSNVVSIFLRYLEKHWYYGIWGQIAIVQRIHHLVNTTLSCLTKCVLLKWEDSIVFSTNYQHTKNKIKIRLEEFRAFDWWLHHYKIVKDGNPMIM